MSGKLTTISLGWVERSETQHLIKVKNQKSKVLVGWALPVQILVVFEQYSATR